jgi:hypothetical protein
MYIALLVGGVGYRLCLFMIEVNSARSSKNLNQTSGVFSSGAIKFLRVL